MNMNKVAAFPAVREHYPLLAEACETTACLYNPVPDWRSFVTAAGLENKLKTSIAALSGGERQRVALARALVLKPAVLLADEPTGNLDSARSREIMELLTGLNRERGITIVMVTHENEAAGYAGRIIHFLDGQIVNDAPNGGPL